MTAPGTPLHETVVDRPVGGDGPSGLGRMYVLLFALLAGVGLNAGWIAAMSYDLVNMTRIDTCLFNSGLSHIQGRWMRDGNTLEAFEALSPAVFSGCMKSATLPWTLTMLAAAVGTLAAAALSMVIGGLWVRWRLRREGPAREEAVGEARQRFGQLCAEHGLTGRPPELWISRPGSRFTEAFTTGVPLRRPLVVVPAGVACGGAARFDPVVHHELAHVKARDVARASAAWWSGWVSVTVTAVAIAPYFDPKGSSLTKPLLGLLIAGGLTLILIIFRAHLLRIREHAADRLAAACLHRPEQLTGLLSGQRPAVVATGRMPGVARLLFACHPSPARRVRLLSTDATVDEGGFLSSLMTALLVLLLVQPVNQVALNSTGWLGNTEVPLYALAGCLIAGLLVPMWVHRATAARQLGVPASWHGPVLGVGLGVTAGFCLPFPGLTVSPGMMALATHWITGPLIFAVVCGMTWLLVRLAQDVDTAGRWGMLLTTGAAALVAGVTLSNAIKLVVNAAGGLRPAVLRVIPLSLDGLSDWDTVLIFGLIALLAVMSALARPRPRRLSSEWWAKLRHDPVPRLMLAMIVIAVTTGTVVTALRLPDDPSRAAEVHLVWQRIWVFAFAGWVVLLALLYRAPGRRAGGSRPPGALARALTTAALTSLVSAFVQFGVEVATGGGWRPAHHRWLAEEYVLTTLGFLLILIVVLAPLATLIHPLLPRRSLPASRGRRHLIAAAVSVSVCVAVMLGAVDVFTGRPGDMNEVLRLGPSTPIPTESAPAPGGNAGRQLSQDEANTIADAIGPVLPGWTRKPYEPTEPDAPADPTACPPTVGEDGLDPVAEAEVVYSAGAAKHPPNGADIYITVASYPSVLDPEEELAAQRAGIARCPRWSTDNADSVDGRSHWRLREWPTGPFPFATLGSRMAMTMRTNNGTIVTTGDSIIAIIGHNSIQLMVVYGHAGEPPETRLKKLDDKLLAALLTAVRKLDET